MNRLSFGIPLLLVLFVAGAPACSSDKAKPSASVEDATTADENLTDLTPDADETTPPDETEPVVLPRARAAHRLTVEQIQRSIPIVTGGLKWIEDFGEGPVDMLATLAPTLGAPDYHLVTEESLEPSMIVAKFLQDAGLRVCIEWVEKDRTCFDEQQQDATFDCERTLVREGDWYSTDEADVKASLRTLMLQFYGRFVALEDEDAIAPYYAVFEEAAEKAWENFEARDGWLGVCVALMTEPEFLIY